MKKILFFDIDSTLFDPGKFLQQLFKELSLDFNLGETSADFEKIYEDLKNEEGYFIPDKYMDQIIINYPKIERKVLEEIFWKEDLFSQSLYSDAQSIRNLAGKTIFGIFSKGDKQFQTMKLGFIRDLLDEKNIHIYADKLAKINDLLGEYNDWDITFVDDSSEVLRAITKATSSAKLFLIDREGNLEDNVGIQKIKSLDELDNLI